MRSFNRDQNPIVTFSPHLHAADEAAAYWLRQVTLRLRREMSWRLREPAAVTDKLSESLGMHRYWEEKRAFFQTDPTAQYLTNRLQETPPPPGTQENTRRGSFGWVIRQLELDPTAVFVLALALAGVFDNAMGSVISACLNDPMKTHPTLALAQKLWDEPEPILTLADPAHNLFRFGLLLSPVQAPSAEPFCFIDWDSPITVPALVATQLLFPGSPLPTALSPIAANDCKGEESGGVYEDGPDLRQVSAALNAGGKDRVRIVPVYGKGGSAHLETLKVVAKAAGQEVVQCKNLPGMLDNNYYLKTLATFCWLRGLDIYLGEEAAPLLTQAGDQHQPQSAPLWHSLQSIPVTIYLSITGQRRLRTVPPHLLLPKIQVPSFSFHHRKVLWQKLLGPKARGLEPAINDCSRRFRYEKETILRMARGLNTLPGPISAEDLTAACRAHLELDLGDLAQAVTPRFKEETLILPHKQLSQFREVAKAMKSLTAVHYEWGTARAWNESGISVLFAGPPGTGKTMAAEILAIELDLPIFRIDLSQVVNKYIGETEKNLKRLFDAADISDMVLFFDEADSLFGKRTEVKDAHDRYANLEISYLLERMERFKGLAILATNRKNDLDEAFLRRLRYIIDFPFPGTEERKSIWHQVIPGTVDSSGIDIPFLARQFQLTGGHIRSIVFNACLQAAPLENQAQPAGGEGETTTTHGKNTGEGKFKGVLTMQHIIAAVKREFDKMGRSVSLDHFGPYAGIVKEMEQKKGNA
jgi:hypothetical protein